MPSFEQFLMTPLSARSILVNLSLLKKKASNRPKTIGVFSRTKSSHSDLRLPQGYLLPDFQPYRSNFFAPPPPLTYLESTPPVLLRYYSCVDDQREEVATRPLLFGLRCGANGHSRASRPS